MAKLANRVRDADTGVGTPGASVAVRGVDGGAAVSTETTDANGLFDYTANGSPGPIEWAATDSGQTRVVAGDASFQSGAIFTGELEKILTIFTAGVFDGVDNELAVTPGTGRKVLVDTGVGIAHGIPYICYTQHELTVTANASGNPRIDTIVFRVTRSGATIGAATTAVVAGTAAGSPVAPSLTQNATTWEIPLADLAVANGAASFVSGNITDRRVNASFSAVQASNANLTALAGLTGAADRLAYFTAAATLALATFTAAGRALVDDADAAAQRTTLGLGTIATQNTASVTVTDLSASGNLIGDFLTVLSNAGILGALSVDGDSILGNSAGDITQITGHLKHKGSAPSAAVGTALGTGGSVGVAIVGTDQAGQITLTAGTTSLTTGIAATITFATARPNTQYPINLTPKGSVAGMNLAKANVNNLNASSWSVNFAVAPVAGDIYIFFYTIPLEWTN